MSEHRKRLADLYLKQLQDKSTASNRLVYLWIAALIIILFTGLEPKVPQVQQLRAKESELRKNRSFYLGISREKEPELRQTGEQKIQGIENQIQEKREVAQQVPFKLPGIEFSVSTLYAPLIWQGLTFGLLLFLFFTRKSLLRLGARATRLYLLELSAPEDALTDYMGGMPWWVNPLPKKDSKITAKVYRQCLGQDTRASVATVVLLVVFATLAAVQVRVTYIGWLTSHELAGHTLQILVRSANLLFLGGTFCIFTRWFAIKEVPDYFVNEENPNKIGRRQFIGYTSLLGVFLVALPALNATRLLFQARKPRFRSPKPTRVVSTSLAAGWYKNQKTSIIHRVLADGVIHVSNVLKQENLASIAVETVFSFDPTTKPRVNLSHASFSFEKASLQSLESGEIDEMCRLLIAGIHHDLVLKRDHPSYRLYDLLAGVALRFGKDQYMQKMLRIIANHPNSILFHSRKRKWLTKNSPWRHRWSDKAKPIRWVGVPM